MRFLQKLQLIEDHGIQIHINFQTKTTQTSYCLEQHIPM